MIPTREHLDKSSVWSILEENWWPGVLKELSLKEEEIGSFHIKRKDIDI